MVVLADINAAWVEDLVCLADIVPRLCTLPDICNWY